MNTAREFNRVGVLMGGYSAEREVSLSSGEAVAAALRKAGYSVEEIDVVNKDFNVPREIEAVFVALHGEFGEDGQIQARLDSRGIPYTGAGSAASRAAFDKAISKRIFVEKGIPTPEYELLHDSRPRALPLPVVVKPTLQGSTIGVHRVLREAEWPAAVSNAFSYGPEVLVEDYIAGDELTVGIVGGEALPVIKIVAPEGWYNYDAKYTRGRTQYLVPAPIDGEMSKSCRGLALRAFAVLGCRGFARVDFRCSESGQLYVLELNTIPGFTATSLLPKAAAAVGISFVDLCDKIMNMAVTN